MIDAQNPDLLNFDAKVGLGVKNAKHFTGTVTRGVI